MLQNLFGVSVFIVSIVAFWYMAVKLIDFIFDRFTQDQIKKASKMIGIAIFSLAVITAIITGFMLYNG